jgi:hypothetical protein
MPRAVARGEAGDGLAAWDGRLATSGFARFRGKEGLIFCKPAGSAETVLEIRPISVVWKGSFSLHASHSAVDIVSS